MRELVLARHAESEFNLGNVLNGDPALQVALTATGRAQARALGVTAGRVDLVAHTEFGRTRQTAQLAWPGVQLLEVPELNEITFGRWEGTRWSDGYDAWTASAGPEEECPGGGESRVAAVLRYLRGYRILLERPEERIALVAHGAQVRLLLLGAAGASPTARLEHVAPAAPFELTRAEVEAAIAVLDAWTAAPWF